MNVMSCMFSSCKRSSARHKKGTHSIIVLVQVSNIAVSAFPLIIKITYLGHVVLQSVHINQITYLGR